MLIRILRPTVARPNGQAARAVEPGELIEVDAAQAAQLIALRKAAPGAVASMPSPVVTGIETPEAAMPPAERRGRRGGRGT